MRTALYRPRSWQPDAEKVWFAQDSPVEEGVSSELVSEAKFPASREFTGNFIELGLGGASTAAKKGIKPKPYRPIPYASEQGIFYGLAGNLNRRSGKFPPSSGNPALVRYLGHFALPTNPIYRSFREISTVCREGKEDAARCSRRRVLRWPSRASRRAHTHRAKGIYSRCDLSRQARRRMPDAPPTAGTRSHRRRQIERRRAQPRKRRCRYRARPGRRLV